MTRNTLPAFVMSTITCASVPAFAALDAAHCAALKDSAIADTRIERAEWSDGNIAADDMAAFTGGSVRAQKAGAHCLVEGEHGARTGADGKHYGTRFQLRLPSDWNHRFLFQGGGGVDGFIAPAVGNAPWQQTSATPALIRGYAVVSMDGGHPTPTPDFGADQQARLDFAYQSIGKITTVAKALIQAAYQRAPAHNYFMGCSNGGREALIAAQRYPLEYDGVIAGNPGFRLSRAAIAEVWDTRQLMNIAPKNGKGEKILANALTQQDLDTVSAAVLAQCDAKDGLKDGIINAWENCDYDPAGLDLPQEKIAALKAIFEGAKNSHGEPIYSGWYYDSGINQPNWRAWKLGTAQDGKPNANNIILGSGSLTQYFMTPYNPGFDLEHFDFDRDPAKTYQTGALNDAISTDLSTYRAGGGKLLVITGVSDPVFSAKDQRDWFAQLQQDTAGTDSFARLYMVPGMTHCAGGNAHSDFEPLSALEQWHDHSTAPEQLTATHANGKQMPLCAWPKIAIYTGGDESKAASYQCR